jgi:hypothetical protein
MIRHIFALILLASAATAQSQAQASRAANARTFGAAAAQRFAGLALACVHKEYPNKISHSMLSDADVAPPRKLTPACALFPTRLLPPPRAPPSARA